MTSSVSSPFKLDKVVVKPTNRVFTNGKTWFARFMFLEAGIIKSVTTWHDSLRVACYAELAPKSWMDADRIGSTFRIGSIGADVLFNRELILADDPPTMEDALWFACKELQPMLESLTTLKGIENNIDIVVEHGLRPTKRMLQDLVQPQPRKGILR